ncbi:MAG: hypothetical protein LBQ66_07520 [Planctomycetaceae bacterium]|jgi:tetrahydromethanopterin S-methyltransferase subunit B|nr:hypothetical protein [Planctomycetaceae bacterium]
MIRYAYRFVVVVIFVRILFLAGLVCCAEVRELGSVASDDSKVTVKLLVSPAKPQLYDTIIFRLEVEADLTLKVSFPDFGQSIGTLKILSVNEEITATKPATEKKTLIIKTIPTQAGTTPIWSIPITYSLRSDEQNIPAKESVVELPATALDIESQIDPSKVSLDSLLTGYELFQIASNNFIWIILIVLFIVAIIILLVVMMRRKKSESKEPELTPQEIALSKIADLIERRLHEVDVKLFFIELSGVVRWYIECQTAIRVPELTTEEFLQEVSQNRKIRNKISTELASKLRLFLESSDMVKFAKFKPSQDEIALGINHAKNFIIDWNNE